MERRCSFTDAPALTRPITRRSGSGQPTSSAKWQNWPPGVVFEDYDFPALKTVDHVATTAGIGKSAWFKDPDGHTVALFQPE